VSGHYVLGADARTPVEADLRTWSRGYESKAGGALTGTDPVPSPGDAWARVAKDVVGDATVSTVFLGLDHAFRGKPILFETLVMGGPCDQDGERYSAWAEAEAGHARYVEKVTAAWREAEARRIGQTVPEPVEEL
jgi:hypothetical protein